MFMIVTYPFPVTFAYAGLTRPQPPEPRTNHREVIGYSSQQRADHLEQMVGWSQVERMRLSWFRLRLAIRVNRRASRRASARRQTRP
jgi:hypothetical protein